MKKPRSFPAGEMIFVLIQFLNLRNCYNIPLKLEVQEIFQVDKIYFNRYKNLVFLIRKKVVLMKIRFVVFQ